MFKDFLLTQFTENLNALQHQSLEYLAKLCLDSAANYRHPRRVSWERNIDSCHSHTVSRWLLLVWLGKTLVWPDMATVVSIIIFYTFKIVKKMHTNQNQIFLLVTKVYVCVWHMIHGFCSSFSFSADFYRWLCAGETLQLYPNWLWSLGSIVRDCSSLLLNRCVINEVIRHCSSCSLLTSQKMHWGHTFNY